jgi:hypothetical protein
MTSTSGLVVVIYPSLRQPIKFCELFIFGYLSLKVASKRLRSVTLAPLHPDIIVDPFTKWGVDFVDCNQTLVGGNQHIIMVVDYFTKWVEAMPTFEFDGKNVTFFIFNQIIATFRIPSDIFTDHGSHFQNEMMEELASKLGFKHGHSSP